MRQGINSLDDVFRILQIFFSDVIILSHNPKEIKCSFATMNFKFSTNATLEKGFICAEQWPLVFSPSVANSYSLVRSLALFWVTVMPACHIRSVHSNHWIFPGKHLLMWHRFSLLLSWRKCKQSPVQDGLLSNFHVQLNKAAKKVR